jgi:hypothetical protein
VSVLLFQCQLSLENQFGQKEVLIFQLFINLYKI